MKNPIWSLKDWFRLDFALKLQDWIGWPIKTWVRRFKMQVAHTEFSTIQIYNIEGKEATRVPVFKSLVRIRPTAWKELFSHFLSELSHKTLSPFHLKKQIMHRGRAILFLLCCAFTSVASQSCPTSNQPTDPCIPVVTWDDFTNVISAANSSDQVVFCPFLITKSTANPFLIQKKITIMCQQQGQCIVDSSSSNNGGRFFKIKGSQAQVTLYGFVFKNAGDHSSGGGVYSAIHIVFQAGGGTMKQLFCSCEFIG